MPLGDRVVQIGEKLADLAQGLDRVRAHTQGHVFGTKRSASRVS